MKILRVDTDERKIGLSRKRVEWAQEEGGPGGPSPTPSGPSKPTTPPTELKGGVGKSTGPLIQPLRPASEATPPEPPK